MGTLVADGDDDGTYSLITGKGYGYETPDADHSPSVRHIRQVYDSDLGRYVFAFDLHIDTDTDKGADVDRQRNEIKTYDASPASMVAKEGESLNVSWYFKLPLGMITTTAFSHIHQLKGLDNKTGTADVDNPLITFTCRSTGSGQQFQVLNTLPSSEGSIVNHLADVALSDFLGEWVRVVETVVCSDSGSYSVEIVRIRDGRVLISLENVSARLWRDGTAGIRPKWGLYRKYGESGDRSTCGLRDETLLFSDFSVGTS